MLRSAFLAKTGGALVAITAPGGVPGTFLTQYTIGINVPLSGPLAGYGNEILKGARACVDETNRFTPSPNRFWGIRTFDDQNSTSVGMSNVFVAASDPSVIGMIGNLTADVTLACLPQYANASFAIVVPTISDDAITSRGFHNVYRLPTKNSSEGQLFARTVLGKRSSMNVVALVARGTYGTEIAQGFVSQAKSDKHNVKTVTVETNADPHNTAVVVMNHQPGYVFLAGKPAELGDAAKALHAQGYRGAFGACDAFFSNDIVGPFGDVMNGALIATPAPPLERVPSDVTLLQDFHSQVGEITAFSAFGYAAAQLLIQASLRSNATSRFMLLQQLQQGGSYNLLVGQYQFNFSGDAMLPNIYFYELSAKGLAYKESAVPNGFVV